MTYETKCRLRADARRDTIIQAAIRVFAEKGFRGATTRELSAAVGVSEPVLYEHFRTKHELYEAILDQMASDGFDNLNALLDVHLDAQDDRSFLLGLAHAIVEWFLQYPEFVRLLLFSSLEGGELAANFQVRFGTRIGETIRRYAEARPSMAGSDPELLAHMFVCMVAHHGLLQVLHHHHPPGTHDEVIEGMVDLLIRGVCK